MVRRRAGRRSCQRHGWSLKIETLTTPAQLSLENVQMTAKDLHVPLRGSIPVKPVSALIKRGWSTAAAPAILTRCRCLSR